MQVREVLRRILIWGIAAVCLATAITLAAFGTWTGLAGFVAFPVVGAVILTSRRGNGVGRYLIAVGVLCVAIMWGLDVELVILASAWVESLMTATAGFFWTGLVVIGVIYPTGRPETALGRAAAWAVLALSLFSFTSNLVAPMTSSGRPNPFAMPGPPWLAVVQQWGFAVCLAATVGIIVVDLGRRWHAASAIAALQYRWFVFGLASAILAVACAGLASALWPGSVLFEVLLVAAILTLNLVPVSIGIAVTRHGLYEINRVVSRTVAYGTLTVLVVAVYAIVVTSATWLLPQLPSVGVAVATLAAAALVLPLLRWVRNVVDRRFDRERYVAEQVVDDFGERLRTRPDPSATADELATAVERTLRPASVGLWTKGGTP